MENVLLRFPHIGCQIFDQLNNPLLTNCREVSNSWKNFVDNERLPWTRIIVHYIKPLQSSWRKFLQKSNIRSLFEMAMLVIQRYKKFESVPENTTPMHFAAMIGNTAMIEKLIQIGAQFNESLHSLNEDILGIDSHFCTPLHYAARNGHLRAYEVIMEIYLIKNPECGYMTPFHMAAKHGHFSICELIINNVEDKNPKNVYGVTPLHFAVQGGFLEICKLIVDKVIDKNPEDEDGSTPLDHAITTGNLAIFKLIFDNIEDKNAQDDNGDTALHLAVLNNNVEMVRLLTERGANVRLMANGHRAPLEMARAAENTAIVSRVITKIEPHYSATLRSEF